MASESSTIRIGYVPGIIFSPHQISTEGVLFTNRHQFATRALPSPSTPRCPQLRGFFPSIQNLLDSLPVWNGAYDNVPEAE